MKRACVIGYGNIGTLHCDILKQLEEDNNIQVALGGICDIDPEKLNRAKEKYSNVTLYSSFNDVLSDSEITSIHICTPHYLHFEMIEKGIKARKDIFCEKPITMTENEFKKLLKIQTDVKVACVLQNRQTACFEKLLKIASSKEYGELRGVKGLVTWHRDEKYYKDNWRGQKKFEGGGALINQSIHTLDLMCSLGGEVDSVRAKFANFTLQGVIDVEDYLMASINFKSGIKGVFFCTNGYAKDSAPEIEAVFENAIVTLRSNKLFVNDKLIMENNPLYLKKQCWGHGHTKAISEFYKENGQIFPPQDIKTTMNAMFKIYESGEKDGAEIKL